MFSFFSFFLFRLLVSVLPVGEIQLNNNDFQHAAVVAPVVGVLNYRKSA